MLSERLRELTLVGAVSRVEGRHGPEYVLTAAGHELADIITSFGIWGQRWLSRRAEEEDNDLEPLLIDMQRRVRLDQLPRDPMVIRFEIQGHKPRFMLLRRNEASLCAHNPGFPELLCIKGPPASLVAWWRGDVRFVEAQRKGLAVEGPRALARAFPDWFDRYLFAHVAPAAAEAPPMAAAAG
jgi:hypothetical protein